MRALPRVFRDTPLAARPLPATRPTHTRTLPSHPAVASMGCALLPGAQDTAMAPLGQCMPLCTSQPLSSTRWLSTLT